MFIRPAHRLFLAIRPPLVVARQIISAASWFGTEGRLLRPEHLHVTMAILDDLDTVDPRLAERLRRVGIAAASAPFDVAFDLATGSTRSVALRPRRKVAGLEALRRAIVHACRAERLPERQDYAFSAHMTIGYRDGTAFSQPIAPVGWHVDELVLIHSHLGKTRHEVVDRWRLAGSAPAQLALL